MQVMDTWRHCAAGAQWRMLLSGHQISKRYGSPSDGIGRTHASAGLRCADAGLRSGDSGAELRTGYPDIARCILTKAGDSGKTRKDRVVARLKSVIGVLVSGGRHALVEGHQVLQGWPGQRANARRVLISNGLATGLQLELIARIEIVQEVLRREIASQRSISGGTGLAAGTQQIREFVSRAVTSLDERLFLMVDRVEHRLLRVCSRLLSGRLRTSGHVGANSTDQGATANRYSDPAHAFSSNRLLESNSASVSGSTVSRSLSSRSFESVRCPVTKMESSCA